VDLHPVVPGESPVLPTFGSADLVGSIIETLDSDIDVSPGVGNPDCGLMLGWLLGPDVDQTCPYRAIRPERLIQNTIYRERFVYFEGVERRHCAALKVLAGQEI